MLDCQPNAVYNNGTAPLRDGGKGVCALRARDEDGDTVVLFGDYRLEDDALGRAHFSTAPQMRAFAGLVCLHQMWGNVLRAGYEPPR